MPYLPCAFYGKDLSDYKYDKLLVKAMALLNRYYSANDSLFKRAVQAQVLITPNSVRVYKEVLCILPTLQVSSHVGLS